MKMISPIKKFNNSTLIYTEKSTYRINTIGTNFT